MVAVPRCDSHAPQLKVVLMDYDYLITKKKLEEEDTFESFLNEKTEFRADALADRHLAVIKKGMLAPGVDGVAGMDGSLMPSCRNIPCFMSSQATSFSSSAAASSSATPWARTAR